MPPVVLLGPQRHDPIVRTALQELGVSGPVSVITAGWQEREPEEDELHEHLSRPLLNLALYLRAEQVFAKDPELFDALRERQQKLQKIQALYRIRLEYQLEAARALLGRVDEDDLLAPEQLSAIDAVRALDAHHGKRVREIHEAFDETWSPSERPEVKTHRQAIGEILERSSALLIAGGHVAILLNRLRLFGVLELAEGKPVVAWSAGAMALSERVVLFHDSPPQGAGDAEVFEVGEGRAPGVVPLPHASARLRLGDPIRVGLFARRFAPSRSVPLEPGTHIVWDGQGWEARTNASQLLADGRVAPEVEA